MFHGLRLLLTVMVIAAHLSGCGVRGRPQPPLTPAEIGRGQPTFRRATQPYAFPNVPPVPAEAQDGDGATTDKAADEDFERQKNR